MHYLIRRVATLSLLAALPGACTEKGEETTAASATETSGDTSGEPTGGSSDDSTGATSDDSTGMTEPTTGEPSPVCADYTEWVFECGQGDPLSEEEVLGECEREREVMAAVYGPSCAAKYDAFTECISDNACDAFDACDAEAEASDLCLPEAGATCMKFAATVAACEPGEGEAEIGGSCQLDINAGGHDNAECGAAIEAMYACYSDLTCEQIAGDGAACSQEVAMLEALCPGEGGLMQSRHLDAHRR
ncbi:MAG TPA: hypothetical protein VGB85_08500 [Nannocystis sp.]